MAMSHSEVAERFVQGVEARGSRLQCRVLSEDTQKLMRLNHPFVTVSEAISYATPIARVVENWHAGRRELWITPQRYSVSTSRHKDHIMSAWHARCRKLDIDPATVTFDAIDRTNPDHFTYVDDILSRLAAINAPRLRDATRRGVVQSAHHALTRLVRNATHGVDPERYETLFANATRVQAHADTLACFMTLSTDDMRAAVKGFLALNEINH
jgi:hypothetical protein